MTGPETEQALINVMLHTGQQSTPEVPCRGNQFHSASRALHLQVHIALTHLPALNKLRLRLQHSAEEVAMPVLVLAPVLKVLEQRVQLVVRVALRSNEGIRDVAAVPQQLQQQRQCGAVLQRAMLLQAFA
jgi:hypothetical protein